MGGAAMKCEQVHELLDAYHDGELQSATSAALEGHLCSCPSCSASFNAHNALRRRVRGLGRTPVPARLVAAISSSLSQVSRAPRGLLHVRSRRALAASHLLAVALGGATVLGLVQIRQGHSFTIQETIDAHVRSLIDERTLMQIVSDDSHNVRPWFMGRLDFSPIVVDLDKDGFALLGARVDYLASRYVAALVYGRRKHRINLFVSPAADDTAVAMTSTARNGYTVLAWKAGGLSYRAVSDLDGNELSQFSELVRLRSGGT
jgi:anti-sigma factor RsiW